MPLVITPEAEALKGVESDPIVIEIEKHDVQNFATAIAWPNKPNPAYYDESAGEASEYGSIVAPPSFGTRLGFIGGIYDKVKNALPKYRVGLNGGLEYIRKAPIRPGDRLTGRGKLANLKESPRDDGGAMLLVTFEGNFTNQDGVDILTSRMTLIWMYGKEDLNG